MDAALRQTLERVRDAAAQRTPLAIRGGGTKAFHPDASCRPGPGVPMLDLRPLAGVVSYEPSELVLTARAGTPLAEVERLLAEQGQCLAFEPPRLAAGGTVGGMVAAGLSGPARASVGAVRDFVLGAEIINGRAELLRYGGQVMKNVAGYDVSRLMAGSWGRLAVITEVSLKVLPMAVSEATLAFDFEQAEALARLHAWGGKPLPLNASCWSSEDGRGRLHLRLRGARAAVQAACRSLGGERLEGARVQSFWRACRDQRLSWFTFREPHLALWRLSLPQTAPALALPPGVAAPLIEWHGGLRWVQAAPEHGPALRALAAQAGGSATLFMATGQGRTRAPGIFDLQDPVLAGLQQRLQEAFDPAGIFRGAGARG
ncbi:glycolate oxidase subunit GlcE [Melaminivora sp.]|uniref:glycolate oxidase subunit GlcE n=1 Tax=Melaminivora sp. TaxID=1933032 RepID=UPI0028AA32D5|nr:glycolate oxidase subunit GlcE [Melaminivora sp.]